MTTSSDAKIRERVQQIETMPAIPAVFLPLLKLLSNSAEEVKVDEVVRLVSYDNTIAGQCLRLASSPLFGLAQAPKSIKAWGRLSPRPNGCSTPPYFGDIRWDAPWCAGNSARS